MKKLFFVSTGRCGTMRVSEILENKLPENKYSVQHQMDISRFANIAGNLMYYFGNWEYLKRNIYTHIINTYADDMHFICSDPLISMILPNSAINDSKVYIVHIYREPEKFANSFYRFTRKRFLSFAAHNFIPFWQIGVLPFENIISSNIRKKYKTLCIKKNVWFKKHYLKNPNFRSYKMVNVFNTNILEKIIQSVFNENIHISKESLNKKSNESKQ